MIREILTSFDYFRSVTRVKNVIILLVLFFGMSTSALADVTKSVWDGTVPSTANVSKTECNKIDINGSGTKEDPYIISTAKQFAYFASKMNGNTNWWKLADNVEIDLDGEHRVWTYGQNNANFKGHFDGNRSNGSLISNMKFETNGANKSFGLFPQIQGSGATNHAEIKNLEIKNFKITTPGSGTSYGATTNVGLLVGKINGNADVVNVTISGTNSISYDVTTTGANYVGALAGNVTSDNCTVKNCTISGVSVTTDAAAVKKDFYLGGLAGSVSSNSVISDNTVSGLSITLNGNTNGNNIIGGLIGKVAGTNSTVAANLPMGKRTLVQKNTVTSPTITMNGSVEVANFELGGLIGWIGNHTNVFNNKVTSPNISLKNDINNHSYVGGAVGYQDGYTFVDGLTVSGTGSITGPASDKIVKYNVNLFVGGYLGYMINSGVNAFQAGKFKNIAVTGMNINLGHYLPQSSIQNHKFSVGGIAGSINSPNMKADGTWGGMPENIIFKGGKIYAPWASTSPTVSNFNAGAAAHNNMTPDVVTTIDAIEKAKVNTWYYNDYKLGLSSEFLSSESVIGKDDAAQHLKFRKNYSAEPAVEDGIKYLAINNSTFTRSNRYQDSERDSKTVLWWTQQASMDKSKGSVAAVTCFTANEQPIYPQSGATSAQAGNLTDYPHYMYFFQGVSNAKWASNDDAGKIVEGIEANFTNNIVPAIVAGSIEAGNSAGGSLVGDGVSVTITNDGETRRGFDNRTLTVGLIKADGTAATGSYTYQWYVDGVADGTGTTKTLTPHWKDAKGITVNVLNGSAVVATASYGFGPGVMHTQKSKADASSELIRSDFNGRGTSANPYIIDCESALRQLSYLSTAHTNTYWETVGKPASPYPTNQTQGHYNRAYYKLGADINLNNTDFIPISHVGYGADGSWGTYNTNWIFQGVFDGAGYTISNFNIKWGASQYVGNNANLYYGLFGAVGNATAARKWGDSADGNTVIKNLIISGATLTHNTAETSFYYDQSISTYANYALVGVLAGVVTSNTTIQNIEIRDSKITDSGSNDYSLAAKGLYVGGAIGAVQAAYNATTNVPANTQIQHIAAKVDITLTKPTIVKTSDATQTGSFNVGGIIGRYVATGATKEQVEPTLPKYTIYSGTINAAKAWISPVVASLRYKDQQSFNFNNHSKHWEGNNNTAATQVTINNALYYNFYIGANKIGANKITDTYPGNTCALGSRTMTAHSNGSDAALTYSAQKYQGVNYGARYVDAENASLELMNGAPFEGYNWVWSDGFVHMSTEDYVEAKISRDGDTFTATLIGAEATNYIWKAKFDDVTGWQTITSAGAATYAAPKSLKPKYIVALVSALVDGETKSYRTLVELVEPNKDLIRPAVTKEGSDFTFALAEDGDISQMTVTNEWYYTKADAENKEKNAEATTATWTPEQAKIQGGIVWCKVTVTELGVTVYEDYLLSGATVVFVKGNGGIDNPVDSDGKLTSSERGWDPENPVQTIDNANKLLKSFEEGGTVDNNIIVVMGTLNPNETTYTNPFQSTGHNPATLTGKYNNIEYNGKLIIGQYKSTGGEDAVNPFKTGKGHQCYVLADTKFEYLTFQCAPNDNANNFLDCHGNDVEFGRGLVMTGYPTLSDNHGNMSGEVVPELTIVLTASNLDKETITEYTQNRKKPQVVTFRSGHYGRLMGGRFTNGFFAASTNTSHTIIGSATNPVWAVVNVEIDSENLPTDGGSVTYSRDINCIIAGLTDGSMFGDYQINLYGGNVAYIVGGNQGNAVPNGDKTDAYKYTNVDGSNGAWGQWPNSSYFGRTVINVEQKSGCKNITVGNLYAGGLGRNPQGSAATTVVDMYMYGKTEVNVKSGAVGNIYAGGAGGVIGLNPWDAHLPYATEDADDKTKAIQDGVQYGDKKMGSWSQQNRGENMASVTLHNLNDEGQYVTEFFNLKNSSTTVNISGGNINGNVYGGGYGQVSNMNVAQAMQGIGSVFGTSNINITGGQITGSVYGGSQGHSQFYNQVNNYGQTITHIAEMNGTVNLNISGTEELYPTIGGNIFGAGKGVETVDDNEFADIARSGNPTLGEQYKTTININIDLPESHPFTGNVYGGGEMGKVDGEINVNIKNGVIYGNIFGAGLGEAGHTETKAMVKGNTYVNMFNAKVNASATAGTGNVFGGGQLGKVFGNTNVNMEDGTIENNVYGGGLQGTVSALAKVTLNGSHVHGNVFGGGDKAVVGTAATGDELYEGDARNAWAKANGTSVVMSGDNATVFGDIFGGGNEAKVEGNTSVYLYTGKFGGNIFGGGNGVLDSNNVPTTFADVTNNTSVYLDGTNVLWDALWDKTNKEVIEWDGTWDGTNRNRFLGDTKDAPIFLNPHNVYGGGNKACRVAGNDSVFVVKGFANAALLKTDIWKNSFYDNNNPHFYVFGGGYGAFTTAKNTFVNVGVKGEYEDATTEEQLAKQLLASFRKQRRYDNDEADEQQTAMAKSAGSRSKDYNLTTDANSDPDKHLGVYDNSFGIPLYTVLGVLGGGYSGLISGNTNVTVGGDTFIHRVYGGGYGSSDDYGKLENSAKPSKFAEGLTSGAVYDAYNSDTRSLRNILGEVGGKTDVTVNGAFVYGDVFGGGAGVESAKNVSGVATTDFVDMARVRGIGTTAADAFTKVTISDNAQIYGSVYGGGDIANVGAKNAARATGDPTYTPADGVNPASLSNVHSFVNIIGGDVYGEVFGGGGGRQLYTLNEAGTAFIKTTAGTDVLGRIEGNTLVHIANTPAAQTITGQDEEPNIWQRIYGGGNLGSVNGNTKVWLEGGNLGSNVIGGGNGYAADDSPESQSHGTYANVYGNTDITIDGGSIIWDKIADSQGNTITWSNARKQLVQSEKEMRQLFVSDPATIRDMLVPYIDNRFFTAEGGDANNVKFPINHNIYGGGRYACHVGTYTAGVLATNTGKSTVTLNHSIIDDKDLLDIRTVAGLCWYSIVNNTSEPQFSVFGGGFGANTKVGSTKVDVQVEKPDNYAAKSADARAWNDYEAMLQNDWSGISNEDKTNLYGGTNENAYRRYRSSRYALSLGVPSHTYMNVFGGGYSGYVVDGTDVNVDGKSGIRNVFGGGLGAVRDRSVPHKLIGGKLVEASLLKAGDTNNASSLDYGRVGGNTDVNIQGGIISLNVYGGGAGVESRYLKAGALSTKADDATLTDFPLMAHVAGKTNVNITGTVTDDPHDSNIKIDGTIIYGKVFGGGDVANVGDINKKDNEGANAMVSSIEWVNGSGVASEATEAPTAFTSTIKIDGGLIFSEVLAGGSGRAKSECADYEKLGGIYGNSRVIVKNNSNASFSPWIWNSIYGGGENGTVYGNSLVNISGGHLGNNIFGGGWGNVNEGISDDKRVSSADIKRNSFVNISGGEYVLTQIWNEQTRTWYPNNQQNSPQFDYDTRKFLINHNIYGGGNFACTVDGSTFVKMTKGLLKKTTNVSYEGTGSYNLFASDEWRDVYNKTGSPHFSVYGGGYGADTHIKQNTNLDINLTGTENHPISDAQGAVTRENLYSNFYSEQGVMDITGGGYSGNVVGKANVKISGDTFARRILGGGFYGPVGETQVDIISVDCDEIFGGGLMGDIGVKPNSAYLDDLASGNGAAVLNIGKSGQANTKIYIHKNVYGGNDVSGNIYRSANLTVYGGNILGNVYGAGNGNYLYGQGDKNTEQVTVNEYYKTAETTYDLVYTVPSDRLSSSIAAAPEAERMVNVNSYRPATQNVNLRLSGTSTSPVKITGNVFGGGNSATVNEIFENTKPTVNLDLGNYLTIGGVFLGCDGDAMFDDVTNYMNAYQDVNKVDLTHTIDWVNNPGNKAVKYQYLPVDENDRPKVYKTNLDLYFQPVEMAVQPTVKWNGAVNGDVSSTTIGTFVCGGNRGNMNVTPNNEGKIVDITFPAGLTILDKIVGGCNNANITYKNTHHEGGYLLGKRNATAASASGNNDIALTVKCQFLPSVGASDVKEGGNVYGGCYKSGTINGDIFIDVQTNMLANITEAELNANRAKDGIALGNVYGAGYGNDSFVYGNTTVLFGKGVAKDHAFPTQAQVSPAKGVRGSVQTAITPVVQNGAAANFIYGGGQQGNLIGNSLVRIYNGTVASSVCGGSYAGYMWGSTQVLVGYPKYYTCKQSGIYNLKRADQWNTAKRNFDASDVIKQKIFLMEGDVVSEEVYDAIKANTTAPVLNSSELSAAFSEPTTTVPASPLTWNDIDINIAEAVYGGGYSLASGSSVAAGTYTVKKYDEDQNLNAELSTSDLAVLNGINSNNGTKGFGGNTTVLVWDQPTNSATAEHISISSQEMTDITASVGENDDLFGYYYKLSNGNYKYVFETGYKKTNLKTESGSGSGNIYGTDGKVYTYNGDGGMYGDGHLSFAEGFRSGELYGYGFAQHTPENAKIMNTFQRMDMLRVTDCAVRMLGSRDYTVNQISTTPYSIIRIGELQMRAENVTNSGASAGNLAAKTAAKSRNFIGLANNIHYIGAIQSSVSFEDTYRGTDGTLGSQTYKAVKKAIIDAYYNGKTKRDGASESEFQKRNDATAANMIGISSGFAMRVQNVYTTESEIKEDYFYGPIIGVVEVNLTDTHKDEAGAYVYADNIHDDANHFLESTGNFVFPYNSAENRYVVDDCYPKSFVADSPTNIEAHYWYVTGWDYYYNAHITGYTYDHSSGSGMNFDSENTDQLMNLMGTNAGADIKIKSITWHSNHPAEFASDLEKRNTMAADTSENVDASGNDIAGKYTLSVGTFGNGSVAGTNSRALSFITADGTDADKYVSRAADEGIHIRLNDRADNSGNDYYQAHLSKPSLATIVLTADAKDSKGNARYKYTPVTGVNQGDNITEDMGYYTYNATSGTYTQFTGQAQSTTTYYTQSPGQYTYTIYLTIDYVLGPSSVGNLKIHNCALPGEMIKIDKGNIQLTGDQTFSQTGTTYTFGKIQENSQNPGKYEFVGDTYTYTVGEEPAANHMLKGIRYDKDGDYILVPAYYFMKGYGVQYGFKVSGINDPFPVAIDPANTLLVHNYHRMLPRSSSGEEYELDQHLDLAAQRAASGDIPEPRIYLVDNKDLTEFGKFLNEKAPATQEVPNPDVGSKYNFGANMQFFLQQDITAIKQGQQEAGITLSQYVAPADFNGILHGDGHVISGLENLTNKYLLGANSGNIYNLGLTTGVITNGDAVETPVNNPLYHCCYTYAPVTVSDASASVPHVVYRMDGTAFTGYTEDDWRYGKVAYDLNQYYLDKRYVLGASGSPASSAASYVENYYANGDYLYADYSANNHYKGSEYLRTAARPNYGEQASLHDTKHTIDASRAVGYTAAVGDTPASCTGYQPLFEEAKVSGSTAVVSTGIKNDYLFWGQRQNADTKLAGTGEKGAVAAGVNVTLPANISADVDITYANTVHLVSKMANRVYRAAGYYGSTVNNGYYYNIDGYAHDNNVTAIDFYGYSDWSGDPKVKTYTNDGNIGGSVGSATGSAVTFYQPIADFGLKSFSMNKGVTRNLLLYAHSNDDLSDSGALNSQTYNENTIEGEISAHVIGQINDPATAPQATYLHLVERTTADKQFNNDLCVPVQFTVSNRAWYVRKPLKYAEAGYDAWEGICLPFTVNRTEASQNGEITHFYGTPSEGEISDPSTNHHTLHHEYWLRGMTSVGDGAGDKKVATFQRPGAGLFNQGTAMSYVFNNPFFENTYGELKYNSTPTQNNWYTAEASHTYSDYIPLTQNVPYIVSFPGYRYYEFDLSSQFYDKVINNGVDLTPAQSVTFNAYGPESDVVNHSTTPVVVPVTGQIATVTTGYDHVGTFMALDNAEYGMVAEGTSFSADINSVLPFRTYIRKKPSAGKSVGRSTQTTRSIFIGNPDNSQDAIDSEFAADPESGVVENGMRIYPQGQKVIVESTYSTTLNVLTPAGAIYRIIDIRPGRNTFSGFRPGIYIVGTKKIFL